jgi:excisionase family DNA binding protein
MLPQDIYSRRVRSRVETATAGGGRTIPKWFSDLAILKGWPESHLRPQTEAILIGDVQGIPRRSFWNVGDQLESMHCVFEESIKHPNFGEVTMMYSVKQVAEMLQVGPSLIAEFVDSGELDAIDVSLTRGKKRRLRIPEDALRNFLDRRRVYVSPPRSRSARKPPPYRVIDFFKVSEPEENGRRRLKVSDVAELLGVTEDHVRQLIAYGHLTAVNVGGTARENRYRIAEKELFALIARSRNEPKHQRMARLRGPDFLETLDETKLKVGIRMPSIGLDSQSCRIKSTDGSSG